MARLWLGYIYILYRPRLTDDNPLQLRKHKQQIRIELLDSQPVLSVFSWPGGARVFQCCMHGAKMHGAE